MKFKGVFQISISLLCILFMACSSVPNELKTAEKLMQTHPDSALGILKKYYPTTFNTNAEKAFFGLLYFQALDKNELTLAPDSLISFSIDHYEKAEDMEHLALSYFYKARMLIRANLYKDATDYYLKALNISKNGSNYFLLGKIYSNLGYICYAQKDYIASRIKHRLALKSFMQINEKTEINYVLLDIGRTYYTTKDYKTAQLYFKKVLQNTTDSTLKGAAFQEIASNLYYSKQYKLAADYAKLSLKLPFKGFYFAYTNYLLGDIYFNLENYDSAYHYASIAIKNPSNWHTKRESYRLLANTCYLKGDFGQMAKFMTQYQVCTDSVRRLESQTKASVLESLYESKNETKETKQNSFWIVSLLLVLLLVGSFLVYVIFKRYKTKKLEIELYKSQLTSKQAFLQKSISQKIEETKAIQAHTRKMALGAERDKIDKELYTNCLHLNNWEEFCKEMNLVFNQIIVKLQKDCPNISQKEIIYCCLHLLEIPISERILLLEATTESIYKLKQRLSRKLRLENTKDLDTYLKQKIQV